MKEWLFIYHSAPEELGLTQDALDLMLVGAAFDVKVNALFIGDGVQHIALDNELESKLPKYVKTFGALEDFGVETVEILQDTLLDSASIEADFRIPVKFISANDMRTRMLEAQHVFHF